LNDVSTYLGENVIGLSPESVAVNDYQIFYVNPRRGYPQRLSIDGVTPINKGMVDFFRDLFISQPNSVKLGGYDPYTKQYFLSVKNEKPPLYVVQCENEIFKNDTSDTFNYQLQLNDLGGDIVLNYNITSGHVTIVAIFNSVSHVASNVTGVGNITFNRTSLILDRVDITITPVGGNATYSIMNSCPVGFLNHYSPLHYSNLDDSSTPHYST
jgi:hypothetical protein